MRMYSMLEWTHKQCRVILFEVLEPNKLPFNGKRFKYRPAVT
ncbi:hypothetical protein sp82g_9 [Bacillus phage SP82G]|nr:hypothetical protein sp82g_9 [Bacillus phage SP82G]